MTNSSEDESCQLCALIKLAGYGIAIESLRTILNDIVARKKPFTSAIFQVEENSTENGGNLVASVLKAHKVQEVFTLCGGHISPVLTASEQLGIRVIDVRHEATAVFAADAVARLRQAIGVAAVTAGPGITNTITALKNAQMAESPVLLLGGGSPTLLKGSGALQVGVIAKWVGFNGKLRRQSNISEFDE